MFSPVIGRVVTVYINDADPTGGTRTCKYITKYAVINEKLTLILFKQQYLVNLKIELLHSAFSTVLEKFLSANILF